MNYNDAKKGLKLFLTLLFLGGLASCEWDGRVDIRDYYFPMSELQNGLVYEYQAIKPDSLAPFYWYYRTIEQAEGTYLSGTYYEVDLIPRQQQTELFVDNGILLEDLYLYYNDSLQKQHSYDVEILQGNLFPFKVSEQGGIFLYKIQWKDPVNPEIVTTLIKNRRYEGDTTYTYKGVPYPCKRFSVRELVSIDQEGVLEQAFSGEELYAKGLGLVYLKKVITKELMFEYELADRYPMDSLEQKFSDYYSNDN